jgi:hypothetical protein
MVYVLMDSRRGIMEIDLEVGVVAIHCHLVRGLLLPVSTIVIVDSHVVSPGVTCFRAHILSHTLEIYI